MPRQPRLDFPGALHHVMARGIEGKYIFESKEDKDAFLQRLRLFHQPLGNQLYSWAVMGNHFHLLIQTGATPLSEFMRRLMTSYAIFYNKKYKRKGHLFQNRYKSIICDKEEYLKPLIRYIHLNPVKAGTIRFELLRTYPYTSHHEMFKRKSKNLLINVEEVLSYFAATPKKAFPIYQKFIEGGLNLKENYEGGGLLRSFGGLKEVLSSKKFEHSNYDERILGKGIFVDQVLSYDKTQSKLTMRFKNAQQLLERLCDHFNLKREDILDRSTDKTIAARDVFVYLGNQFLGQNLTKLGRLLNIHASAASHARKRGRVIVEKANLLEKLLN
jgi:REP element-mobilizing transposase RayT